MLQLLSNNQIDKKSWDGFIQKSAQKNIYALSWYLDIVAPNWSALVVIENGLYKAVMPLYLTNKFCIKILKQPLFCQQLGIFTSTISEQDIAIQQMSAWLYKEVRLCVYNFNIDNTSFISNANLTLTFNSRLTHHLYLNPSVDKLRKSYSENQRRNIKKAKKAVSQVRAGSNFDLLIDLFKLNKGEELSEVKDRHYANLKEIYEQSLRRGIAKLFFAYDEDGEILSAALFLSWDTKIIYLFGASSEKGRSASAMALIFDNLIESYADQEMTLDFEGSNIPSIARFYKGFGAEEKNYYNLTFKRLL